MLCIDYNIDVFIYLSRCCERLSFEHLISFAFKCALSGMCREPTCFLGACGPSLARELRMLLYPTRFSKARSVGCHEDWTAACNSCIKYLHQEVARNHTQVPSVTHTSWHSLRVRFSLNTCQSMMFQGTSLPSVAFQGLGWHKSSQNVLHGRKQFSLK